MAEVDVQELQKMESKLTVLAEKCEKDFASKKDVAEITDIVKAFGTERAKWELKSQKHNVFGDMSVAKEMVDYLGYVVSTHPKIKSADPLNMGRSIQFTKTALDSTTDNVGKYTVPTSVSSALSILITEFGKARTLHEVIPMTGNMDLPIATDDATAAYTTNDTTNGADTNQTFSKATLSPKQFLAIYRASGKLLYNSAVDVASMIGSALARAGGRLEDDTCWIGDGSSTYASQTGYEDNTSVPVTSVTSISAITADTLVDLKYKASEAVDGEGTFYIARKVRPVLRKLKGTTNDHYIFEIAGGNFEIDGTPVVTINRFHDGSTHGDMVVLYGNLRQAGRIGVNRDMAIDLDTSVDFIKAGLVWRLLEDFAFAIPQPTAVAKIRVGSSSTITT